MQAFISLARLAQHVLLAHTRHRRVQHLVYSVLPVHGAPFQGRLRANQHAVVLVQQGIVSHLVLLHQQPRRVLQVTIVHSFRLSQHRLYVLLVTIAQRVQDQRPEIHVLMVTTHQVVHLLLHKHHVLQELLAIVTAQLVQHLRQILAQQAMCV